MENKEVLEPEVIEEPAKVEPEQPEIGAIEKWLSKVFKGSQEPKEQKEVEPVQSKAKENEDTDKNLEELIAKKAEELFNQKMSETMPKIKKAKTDELNKQEQELKEREALAKVDEQYQDFIKHKMKEEDFDLDTYLKENPVYQVKNVPSQNITHSTSAQKLRPDELAVLKTYSGN